VHNECIDDQQKLQHTMSASMTYKHMMIAIAWWTCWWLPRVVAVVTCNECVDDLQAYDDCNCTTSVSTTNKSYNAHWRHWRPISIEWEHWLVKKG
jgi:hypothetical protein